LGDYQELDLQHRCRSLMGHPAKMKRVWLEKSCKNILSTEVKKLSLEDMASVESDPKLSFTLQVSILRISTLTEKYLVPTNFCPTKMDRTSSKNYLQK
jgi:hypothetical protein